MLSARAASAKPKVVLTQIDGDTGGDVRSAVAEAIEGKELSLVGSKEVNRAVDKLGELANLTEKDFRTLAIELEADAVVSGKLDKVGSAKTLKFRIYVHKKMAKGFTVSFKDAKSDKFRSALHDKILDKLGVSPGSGGDDDKPSRPAPASDDVKPDKKAKPGDDEPAKPAAAAEVKPAAELATPAAGAGESTAPRKATTKVAVADGAPAAEVSATRPAERVRPANLAAARAEVGASLLQRSTAFSTIQAANKPNDSSLAPAPGVRVEAEVYPLELANRRGRLAGLGIGFSYDRSFGLSLATTTAGVTVPVNQSMFSVDLRYRLAFGDTPMSSTLTVGVGYGKREFAPQRGGLADQQTAVNIARDLPTVDYAMVIPGAKFRMPLTPRLAASLGVSGLLILDAGGIQQPDAYGEATVYGIQSAIALDILLGKRFVVRVAGEFTQIAFSFQGTGQLSNNVDGNTATVDVTGMTDRAIGGSATFAVVY
jgi:hypothetical protein